MMKQRDNETVEVRPHGNRRVSVDCGGDSKVEQQHRDRCNINSIMNRARARGMMPQMERIQRAQYGDFTGALDFQTLNNRIIEAKNQFAMLPSEIRKRFENDPGKLIEFLNDPTNAEEAAKLGLRKPVAKPVVNPPVEPPEAAEVQTGAQPGTPETP